jgi:hypothetical protein
MKASEQSIAPPNSSHGWSGCEMDSYRSAPPTATNTIANKIMKSRKKFNLPILSQTQFSLSGPQSCVTIRFPYVSEYWQSSSSANFRTARHVRSACRCSANFEMPSDFDNTRSTPIAPPSDLEKSSKCIEKRTIFMRGMDRFRITAASAPVITGIDKSSKTKSGSSFLAFSMASTPCDASPQML